MNAVPRGLWCVLSDADAAEIARLGAAALASGAAALTLRRPRAGPGAAVAAWRAPPLAGAWRAVHARADWAAASGSAAVITGARSLPVAALRRTFPALAVGASVHDRAEAEAALAEGAGFLLFGPVWETPEKRGVLAPRGLAALAEIVGLGAPVIAIGGVTDAELACAARDAGAHGCAALRAAREPARTAAIAHAWL